MTHFLTHIFLHAGRIFRQRRRNRIICLVVESALNVYKGQFSPWFGQLMIQTLLEFTFQISQEFTTGLLIHRKFVISASGTVLSKCSTSRLVKNSRIWPQPYIIIAYIINFQVLSTPGQVQIKFHLYLFGICLQINWVVELRKVCRTTASLAL